LRKREEKDPTLNENKNIIVMNEAKPVTIAIQHRGSTLDTAEMHRKILETGRVCVRVTQF